MGFKIDVEESRFNMVEQQIRPWGVLDDKVLALFFDVKREVFVPSAYKNLAFSDLEIPLPGQQKMLCPRVEAKLVQELNLEKTDKVLEIGTGTGFVTALLSKISDFVYSIEIDEQNRQLAVHNLTIAGINNTNLIIGNGLEGLPNKAPFNKIFIGGAVRNIPDELKSQLAIGGKLVGVVGDKPIMYAVLLERIHKEEFKETKLFEVQIDYLVADTTQNFKF